LFNKGPIDAVFSLVPPTTALGSCFTFVPKEGEIAPDSLQVINISFSSTILGPFTEHFQFGVKGSSQAMTLIIRGCVIRPTFHFDVPSLDFGDVPFGFPRTLSCCLINTSLVPMTFDLRIPGDGDGSRECSTTSSIWLMDKNPQSWRKGSPHRAKPMEFTIVPCRGTICPLGSVDIEVTLCSNTAKEYSQALVVDVDGVGKDLLELHLTARCIVPLLKVVNPIVTFGQCLLNFPYNQTLTLVNNSHVPGCFRLLPQEHEEEDAVLYSSHVSWGIIKPKSYVNIPLKLKVQKLG
ncbi:HYDIN protein, partial [Heliornis fulica]|nr:HYDIN protein [Heliornis fulica]